MYQDDRFIPCDLPPCDCLPDRDYPENPDWLWFFEQINDALSEVENIDQVIAQVKANQKAIKILQDNQYRLPVAASAILGGVKADPVTPEDKQPVHIDAAGKLWTAEGGKGEVESVNGKKGVVNLTAEDVGALPDDTPIPPAYNLPTASGAILGGVKADAAHSDDTQPVRIGTDNKLYTKPGTGGGSGGDNEVSVQLSTEPVPPEAEIVVFTDEQNPLTLEDVTGAQPGDLMRITSVDEKGVPTALEPVSMGELEGEFEDVLEFTLENDASISFSKWPDGTPFRFLALELWIKYPSKSSKKSAVFASTVGNKQAGVTGNLTEQTQYMGMFTLNGQGISVKGETGIFWDISNLMLPRSTDYRNWRKDPISLITTWGQTLPAGTYIYCRGVKV